MFGPHLLDDAVDTVALYTTIEPGGRGRARDRRRMSWDVLDLSGAL